MPSGHPDASPSSGKGRGHVGMKNDDGREGGKGWDRSDVAPGASKSDKLGEFKSVGVEPNDGLVEIVSKGTKGLGEVIE